MIVAFYAEWLKITKRPALWSIVATLGGVLVLFVYVPGWWFFAHGPHGLLPVGFDAQQARAEYYPQLLIPHFMNDMAGLVGAACLALGVLSLGSDFAWGSIHTITSLPPSRLASLAGRLLALAAVILALNVFLWSAAAGLALTFAGIDGAPAAGPPLARLAAAFATTWLIDSMWCALGVLLAAAFRQAVVPLAVGLIYMLVIEGLVFNLLGSTGSDLVRDFEKLLPGPNAGALLQAFGHGYMPAGAPAPVSLIGAWQAVVVVATYLLLFCSVTALFVRNRDLTQS